MNPNAAPGGSKAAGGAIDPSFWRGKRVFVTGHTGFKGGWLCVWLQSLGALVFGYARAAPTEPNLYGAAGVAAGMAGEVDGDIRDLGALTTALRHARPDVVIHMAAQTIVTHGYEVPIETFSVNVVGTVTLLEAVRSAESVRAVIAVTSDKCYENREWAWGYRENDALGGHDPYSASKAAAELAVAAMRRSFFTPDETAHHRVGIASVRAGNVIGGGDWAPHRLVPDLMRALLAGRQCVIRNPEFVRPWQHVLEPLSGYLRLAEALWRDGEAYAGGWNFGPLDDNARPVWWLADRLCALWRGAQPWVRASEPGRHENTYLKLDTSKSQSMLGWRPVWSLDTTLASIADWFAAYRNGARMQDLVREQIERFCLDAARPAFGRVDRARHDAPLTALLGEGHAPA
jgi:CDP-glucose 4,6-dehydratase